MSKKRAVVCLSGGMDSATAVFYAIKEMELEPVCVSFDYGSKHNEKERAAGIKLCGGLAVSYFGYTLPSTISNLRHDVDVPFLSSALLKSGREIPEGHYAEESMKATVVPFRNGIMLSLTVGFAESRGIDTIILGNHFGDHAIYPDCRKSFIEGFKVAAAEGTYNGMKIISPFVEWTKSDIAAWGLAHGVPYENTWTCYNGQQDRPCLKCGTCMERTGAFLDTGIPDPLLTLEEWNLAVKIHNKILDAWNAKP